MVGGNPLLGVPPHRVACAFGIHDDGGMGTIGDRGTVGVVQVIARVKIACMPTVYDQRRGSGPEVVDVLMQHVELMRDAMPGEEFDQSVTEPMLCTA